jgi:hypothetical protein
MKTIKEEVVGKATLRLLEGRDGLTGIVIVDGKVSTSVTGGDKDNIWQELKSRLSKVHPDYFGYEGAKIRFLKMFKDGFAGKQFNQFERDYKVAARDLLLATVPIGKALVATSAECDLIAKVYAKTNMLSQFEHARVREVLKSEQGPQFVSGAASLAIGQVSEGLASMSQAIKKFGPVSWPAATYLPFLWYPDTQMFLKPQVTKDFAERVGHSFTQEYSAAFSVSVYESLQNLTSETEAKISDLNPKDRIDIQSFIWIVGAYEESDADEQRVNLSKL